MLAISYRRTLKQDIEFIKEVTEDSLRKHSKYSDCRYMYKQLMSEELFNILVSMGLDKSPNSIDFKLKDSDLLEAVKILELLEEEGDGK